MYQTILHTRSLYNFCLVYLFLLCASDALFAQERTATQLANPQNPYSVSLMTARGLVSFTPAENVRTFTPARRSQGGIQALPLSYYVVQFSQLPSQLEKQALQKAGVELLDYVSGSAYFAAVREDVRSATLEQNHIRAIVPVQAEWKYTAELLAEQVPEHAESKPGYANLIVSCFSGVERHNVEKVLQQEGAEIITYREGLQSFSVRVPRTAIHRIAELPFVQNLRFVSPRPVSENQPGRGSHRVNVLRSQNATIFGGRNLTGEGVRIGIWDGGGIGSHIDLSARLNQRDQGAYSAHATHVLGTIAGAGNKDPRAEGMAPKARLYAWDFGGDIELEEQNGISNFSLVISSHSYGQQAPGNSGYGFYNGDSRDLDGLTRRFPFYTHVHSAGNSGSGFQTITGTDQGTAKTAKNILVVANITNVDALSASSSRGPTLDGRLMPQISAIGTNVYSTQDNNDYALLSGTSMSTPGVTGTIALLYQRFQQLNTAANPRSAFIKALICNTADDLGNPGPDYSFGYGKINALRAVEALEKKWYTIDSVENNQNKTTKLTVPAGTQQLKIMLCWTDREAIPGSVRSLVNDLNVQITTPSGTIINPWILDPLNPAGNAVRGIDNVNNMEQITLDKPETGEYIIRITGAAVPFGPQEYALAYDMIGTGIQLTMPSGSEQFVPGQQEFLRWSAAGHGTTPFTIEYSTDDGATWRLIASVPANQTVFAWTPPENLTTEKMRIRVSSGVLSASNAVSISSLSPPLNLRTTGNNGSIRLSWVQVPGVSSYEVLQYNLETDSWSSLTTTTGETATFTNLKNGARYWYAVRSKSANGSFSQRSIAVSGVPGTPYSITGQVTQDGEPMSGIKVSISGDMSAFVLTDTEGKFTFPLVTGEITVAPTQAGILFTPASYTFPVGATGIQNAQFRGNKAINIGAAGGNANNASNNRFTPYSGVNSSVKSQILITAAEIRAAGGTTGTLAALGFTVATLNEANPLPNYKIRIAPTTITQFSSGRFVQGNFVTVFSTSAHIPVEGLNLHTFTTPYKWDGASNLIVETCFSGALPNTSPTLWRTQSTPIRAVVHSTNAGSACDSVSYNGTSTLRPNVTFNFLNETGIAPLPTPVLESPANFASQLETEPTFIWGSASRATMYRVEVSETATFTTLLSSATTPAPRLKLGKEQLNSGAMVTTGKRYFWRVRAESGNQTSAWSEVRTFATRPTATKNGDIFMSTANGELYRLSSGSSTPELLRLNATGILGMSVDTLNQRLFVVRSGAAGTDEQFVTRMDVNGDNEFTVAAARGTLIDVAIDAGNNRMYWSNSVDGTIHRADPFGYNAEVIIAGQTNPWGIAIDLSGDKIYWTELNAFRVRRANLDGSNIETLWTGTTALRGLKINPITGHVYFAETTTGIIWRMNMDGSNPQPFIREPRVGTVQAQPRDIEVDIQNGYIYWTNQNVNQCVRANLADGSERTVLTTAATAVTGLASGTGIFSAPLKVSAFVRTQNIPQNVSTAVRGIEVTGGIGNLRLVLDLGTRARGALSVNTTIRGGVAASQVEGAGSGKLTITASRAAINQTLLSGGLLYLNKEVISDTLSISVTDSRNANAVSNPMIFAFVVQNTAAALLFDGTTPAEAVAGTPLPEVKVNITDVTGKAALMTPELILTATFRLISGVGTSTATYRVGGSPTTAITGGSALFRNVMLQRAGTYSVSVMANTLGVTTSHTLVVAHAAPAALTMTTPILPRLTPRITLPSATAPIPAIVTTAVVEVRDAYGNRVLSTPHSLALTFVGNDGYSFEVSTTTSFSVGRFIIPFTTTGTFRYSARWIPFGLTTGPVVSPTFTVVVDPTIIRPMLEAAPDNDLIPLAWQQGNNDGLQIALFPNPVSASDLTLQFELNGLVENGNGFVSFSGVDGKTWLTYPIQAPGQGLYRQTYDIRSLPSGVYLCTITFGSQRFTRSLRVVR